MSEEENGLVKKTSMSSSSLNSTGDPNITSNNFIRNFSNVIVDGLLEEVVENNNNKSNHTNTNNNNCVSTSAPALQGLPAISPSGSGGVGVVSRQGNDANLIINVTSFASGVCSNGPVVKQQHQQNNSYLQLESSFSLPLSPRSNSGSSSLEGASSLESANSTVSFVTEIEIIPGRQVSSVSINNSGASGEVQVFQLGKNEPTGLTMETEQSSVESAAAAADTTTIDKGASAPEETDAEKNLGAEGEDPSSNIEDEEVLEEKLDEEEAGFAAVSTPTAEFEEEGYGDENDEDEDDSTTLSSEAVVDDIELILMPEMCQDMPQTNLSPKLVRVTELKVNVDDVFGDDDDDDDQSGRHEFRSIVDDVCEEEQDVTAGNAGSGGEGHRRLSRLSVGDDDVSSGSELISGDRKGASGTGGESSKSSSSSGRRRRSTSGRISSGVQTDITAVEEPAALLSSHHGGYRMKSSGKSSLSARLGVSSGKKLNWKSELTLLPSKMKVKQAGFNSFESNDERDQYSPRVAKFTSQDTLNLSSQFLKPSTLYRTRNLSRNLNQFASSESTFMLPMSSEQQLTAESPRFRDRVSSSTSGVGGGVSGNFRGTAASHSHSAYQISSILSGSGGGVGGSGIGLSGSGYYGGTGAPISSARRQPLISGYSSGSMMMSSSRHFRSSMPDLNAVNKSYAAAASMADSHRRRPHKSIKHHHSSSGFRLQKRSSSDEETSSLIDESERCLRSSIDLLLTDELPSPGGDSCFRSTGFGSSSLAGASTGFYSARRTCSQPILNDQAYPPEMRDPSMGSPFLPRKLSDMRCSRWAKVILPNGHVAVVSVKETDEIQNSLTIHTDTGCVINLPFRKVVFAWKTKR